MQSITIFLDITKIADIRLKMLMSAELKGFATWFACFLNLFQVRYNCVKVHNCRIYMTDFSEGGLFVALHPLATREKAHRE